jgi:hypothetical protein
MLKLPYHTIVGAASRYSSGSATLIFFECPVYLCIFLQDEVWGLLRENSRLLDHFTSLLTAAGPLGRLGFINETKPNEI